VALLATIAMAQANVTTRALPQGVLIREADVKIRALEWRVIVTLDNAETYDDLVGAITQLAEDESITSNKLWNMELKGLESRLQRVLRATRSRRGLIDGIGLITHSLLGIATDADVEEV
jgi:hypothetical protein